MRPSPAREAGLLALDAHARLHQVAFKEDGTRRTYDDRRRLLEEYKVEVKKEYRRRARELHPDMNQGLSEDEQRVKGYELSSLTEATDYLLRLEAKPPPAQRPLDMRPISRFTMEVQMAELDRLMAERRRRMMWDKVSTTSTASSTTGGFHFDW